MFTHFPVTSSQFHFSRWRLLLPSLPLISTLRARPHLGRRVFGAANTNDSALFSGSGNIVTGQIKTDSNSKLRNHKAFLKAGAPSGVIHDTNFAPLLHTILSSTVRWVSWKVYSGHSLVQRGCTYFQKLSAMSKNPTLPKNFTYTSNFLMQNK